MWTAACAGSLIAVIAAIVAMALWILTPARLTPLVEKYANGYLNADIQVGKVELTLRRHFPLLELNVDSLTVISKSLESINTWQRAALPAYADTLLDVPHLSGGINLASLLTGRIDLHNVELVRPTINIVYTDSLTGNINIAPTDSMPADTSATVLPEISINRFMITGEAPIRYFSLADSIDAELTIRASALTSDGLPVYEISTQATAIAGMGSILPRTSAELGIDGKIHWNPHMPMHIGLSDCRISLGELAATLDISADMTGESPTIKELGLKLHPTRLTDIIELLPEAWGHELRSLESDMLLSGSARLLKPYIPASGQLPCVSVSLDIPDGQLDYEQIHILKGGIGIDCDIIGDSLKASSVNIRRLHTQGKAMDLAVTATIREPFHDPLISGNFSGHINMSSLPQSLKKLLPVTISGIIKGDTGFRFRMSHLNMRSVHRIKMDGRLQLSDLDISCNDSMSMYMHRAELKLGTGHSFVRDSIRTDSLLTLSATMDSARIMTPELYARLTDLKMGLGCKNTASMLDTSSITPIGATIHAGSVWYKSRIDSARMFIRDIDCGAILTRFKGEKRVPVLGMKASLQRAFVGTNLARISLHDGYFDIRAHLNPKPSVNKRMQARYDSIAAANPGIGADSIRHIMMARYRRSRSDSDVERMSMTLDQGTAALLRRLDLKGSLSASSGRIITPMFPLRNSFTGLDCHFTTDSIVLRRASFNAGVSDLTVSGAISNIRNNLAFAHSRRPLRIDLNLESDTFNINQLTQAVFRGMLAAQNHDTITSTDASSEADNDTKLQDSIVENSGQMQGAVLVPVNVAADISVNARNVIYANVPMHDFHGSLQIENGAVNLRDLSARTGIGAASLNALYYAPRKTDITFGMGLKLDGFHIDKVVQLIPQIDSIMPILNGISGIIDVNLATTTRIDSLMNFDLPSLKAAMQMQGDSLVVIDPDTYRTMAKWLMFKNKNRNMINHMEVEMTVENSMLELYPFIFDFDRYRLGVMGSNDLDMNLNYHVSVLKSPLPFKFGINITGTTDDMKIRVGKARFKEDMAGKRVAIADTTRINLISEIDQVFRRGINTARLAPLKVRRPDISIDDREPDTISQADSVTLINEGLIAAPPKAPDPASQNIDKKKPKKRK